MWNMDTGFEQTLEGHQGAIYSLAQGVAYLFSGGDDTGIKTWQFSSDRFEPLVELKGHQAPVQALRTTGMSLVSADRTGQVNMWALEGEQAGQLQGTIQTGHGAPLMALWVEESYLFTAALDGHVKVWDAQGSLQYDQVQQDTIVCPCICICLAFATRVALCRVLLVWKACTSTSHHRARLTLSCCALGRAQLCLVVCMRIWHIR